jgi:hypothetical protein
MPPIFVIGPTASPDRQQPHPPEHPDRRSPVRRGRAAPWQRQAASRPSGSSAQTGGRVMPAENRQGSNRRHETKHRPNPRRCGCAPSRRASPACRARCWPVRGRRAPRHRRRADLRAPDPRRRRPGGEELYSTENRPRPTACRPAARLYRAGPGPGAAGRSRWPDPQDAQNRGQPVVPPPSRRLRRSRGRAPPCRGRSRAHQRVFFQSGPAIGDAAWRPAMPGLAGLDLAGQGSRPQRRTAACLPQWAGRPAHRRRRIASWRRPRPTSFRPGR